MRHLDLVCMKFTFSSTLFPGVTVKFDEVLPAPPELLLDDRLLDIPAQVAPENNMVAAMKESDA